MPRYIGALRQTDPLPKLVWTLNSEALGCTLLAGRTLKTKILANIFRPTYNQATQRIRLKGLTPEARCRIRPEDGSVPDEIRTGNNLTGSGLKVKPPH
jgi:hypothetical protein